MFDSFKKNIESRWQNAIQRGKEAENMPRQKVIIIAVVLILAFLLWLVVNLNRDYTINIKVPVVLGQVSANKALAKDLPKNVDVSVSGEGWDLLTIYRNPPHIFIEVSDQQVNLFEQVRRQINASSNLNVQKVDPLYLSVNLQKKASKKVPVIERVKVGFKEQFGFLESPQIKPDSITISGARSVIGKINYWQTEPLKLKNIKKDVAVQLALEEAGSLITLSAQSVQFRGEVAKYTEGEVTVPVELKSFRPGHNVIFSPQEVKISYLAPIEEFPNLREPNIFSAYVLFSQLTQDTTGFVAPRIEQLADSAHLKLQQVQPRQVAYFNVVPGEG